MDTEPPTPVTLVELGRLVGGHVWVERALFELCGAWSAGQDAATDEGAVGAMDRSAEVAVFLAAQSAFHGWRADQWTARLPVSVDAEVRPPNGGWSAAVQRAADLASPGQRLAVWSLALQPMLVARYRRHRDRCGTAADAGLRRWLGLALTDCLDGVAGGTALLGETDVEHGAMMAVAVALEELLVGGDASQL